MDSTMEPSLRRKASCACGQLSLVTSGEPVRISICHCLECQARTGSVFGAQARWPAELVSDHSGVEKSWERLGDDGGRVRFHFCPTCGSTVWYEIDAMPGVVAVPVGAFRDPSFPAPRASVYESRRHRWVRLPDALVEHWD
jgi:hypothetical protein